jgi:drug/metabolite transporter (DMT)-like permease
MTPLAVGLVLTSALAHASWNLLAKNASQSRVFAWLCTVAAAIVTAPLAIAQTLTTGSWPTAQAFAFPVVSGLIHVGYFWSLSRAYQAGDLSLVYPLARGSGPLLAVLLSVVSIGERPSLLATIGIAGILLGVVCLTGDPRALFRSKNGASVGFAFLTGAIIAAYTVWDKYGVSGMGVPPVVYFSILMATCGLSRAPWALSDLEQARIELRKFWKVSVVAGVLIALAYTLVLTALVTSPVTYVAPMREIGILFGAILGHKLLAEGQTRQRLAGSALMVLGVSALAVG